MGVGPQEAKLMLVGEAPGPDEVREGAPFVGPAGRVLNIALMAAGVPRAMVRVDNVVKCMPPGAKGGFRKPTANEVEFCASRWLDTKQANVVVALGDTAARWLGMPKEATITTWRGAVLSL